MSDKPKFLELYMVGKVDVGATDDFVDRWHDEPGGRELHDYLGMTEEEYALWLRHPDALPDIAAARRDEKREKPVRHRIA